MDIVHARLRVVLHARHSISIVSKHSIRLNSGNTIGGHELIDSLAVCDDTDDEQELSKILREKIGPMAGITIGMGRVGQLLADGNGNVLGGVVNREASNVALESLLDFAADLCAVGVGETYDRRVG